MKKLFVLSIFILMLFSIFPSNISAANVDYGKVIMIGDSYAGQSYDTSNCIPAKKGEVGNTCRADNKDWIWTKSVAKKLKINDNDKYISNLGGVGFVRENTKNDGSGEKVNFLGLLKDVSKSSFDKNKVKLIIVAGGANDVKDGITREQIKSALEEFVKYAHEQYGNARIVIAPVGWVKYSKKQFESIGYSYEDKNKPWESTAQERMTNIVVPAWKEVADDYPYVFYVTKSENILREHEKEYFTGVRHCNAKKVDTGEHGCTKVNQIIDEDIIHPNLDGQNAISEHIYNYINNLFATQLDSPKLSAIYNSSKGIDIRFSGVTGAKKYLIMRKLNGKWSDVATVNDSDLMKEGNYYKFIDTTVVDNYGKGYYYSVSAIGENGKAGLMNATSPLKIYRIKNPTIKSIKQNGTNVNLTWSKEDCNGYEIQYSLDNGKTWSKSIKVDNGNTTSKTISNLTKNKKYTFKIRSWKENKDIGQTYSQWSSYSSITLK